MSPVLTSFLVQQQRSAKRDDVSVSLLLAYSNEIFHTSCAYHYTLLSL